MNQPALVCLSFYDSLKTHLGLESVRIAYSYVDYLWHLQNDLLPNKMLKMLSALLNSTLVKTSMKYIYIYWLISPSFVFVAGKQKYVLSVALFSFLTSSATKWVSLFLGSAGKISIGKFGWNEFACGRISLKSICMRMETAARNFWLQWQEFKPFQPNRPPLFN